MVMLMKAIHALADMLELDGDKLFRSAKKAWFPAPVKLIRLKQISSAYGDMIVNAYITWDKGSRRVDF